MLRFDNQMRNFSCNNPFIEIGGEKTNESAGDDGAPAAAGGDEEAPAATGGDEPPAATGGDGGNSFQNLLQKMMG